MNWFPCGAALVAVSFGFSATIKTLSANAQELSTGASVGEPAHVQPQLADREAWKRITLGQYRGVQAVRQALDAARVRIGDMADEAIGRPAFGFSTTPVTADLVVVTAAELGFTREATQAEIERQAVQIGLELCPAEVAPLLRLAYPEQPVGEFLRIAMKPVVTWDGTPVSLTVANGGTGPILIGGESRPDLRFVPTTKFVFTRPQRLASP